MSSDKALWITDKGINSLMPSAVLLFTAAQQGYISDLHLCAAGSNPVLGSSFINRTGLPIAIDV